MNTVFPSWLSIVVLRTAVRGSGGGEGCSPRVLGSLLTGLQTEEIRSQQGEGGSQVWMVRGIEQF